jgi:glycosyltransferase involved in cell wall biosynthesis
MKGYHLLRNSVQRAQLRNTDLLAVDHSMLPNEERHEFWGTTPVRFVGLVPQDQIGKLYGQFDVLCAVSLWPESFGLVAREALHYGKWVIVSGLGALADAIVPERNGWVVDVSDSEGLVQLLRRIDSSPEKFAQPSRFVAEERTVSAQTDEIVGVYRKILQPDHLAPLRPRPLNGLTMLPVNNGIAAQRRTASRKSRAAAI